ncbi:MAG: uroporphyrinogen decarboxylase family protein [bacterium]
MNSRERLNRCFSNNEIDRPGVYSRTSYPHNDPTYDRLKVYLAEYSDLKLGWYNGDVESQYPAEICEESYSQDFVRIITILHTPAGDLKKTYLQSLKNQPGLEETYLLKSAVDAERYLSLPVPDFAEEIKSFFEAEKQMGDRGIVDIKLGTNPAGFAARLFGSENFAIMSITDREVLHSLCDRRMKIIMDKIKYFISNNVGPFFSMEGEEFLVPPLHGPEDFYDFNVKYDKPIIDLIHESGGRFHIHSHGSIKSVLKGFIEMGADVLHPFEPPPMGDITPREAKDMVRNKLCIEGNIQIADMYEHTPEQIREQTRELIEDAFDDHKGLIVCPTASPYLYGQGETCFKQYKAMVDTVINYS